MIEEVIPGHVIRLSGIPIKEARTLVVFPNGQLTNCVCMYVGGGVPPRNRIETVRSLTSETKRITNASKCVINRTALKLQGEHVQDHFSKYSKSFEVRNTLHERPNISYTAPCP